MYLKQNGWVDIDNTSGEMRIRLGERAKKIYDAKGGDTNGN